MSVPAPVTTPGGMQDLCRRSAADDRDAFALLVDATQDELMPLACLLVHDAVLAEDCLQESYLVAWRRRHLLADVRDPAAWLRVVLRQVAANARRFRDVRRRREQPLSHDVPWADAGHPETGLRHILDHLRTCLDTLSPTARQLVEAHYRDGIALTDLAQEAGRGDSWIRMTLLRIRRALAACMARNGITTLVEDLP